MLAVMVSSLAACSWGASDFLGGSAAKRQSSTSVTFWISVFQIPAFLVIALATRSNPSSFDLLLGLLAGLADGAAFVVLYRAIARGAVSVVASVTGLMMSALPVTVAVFTGDAITAVQLAGIIVCVLAVVMVSYEPSGLKSSKNIRSSILAGFVAGSCFGMNLSLLGKTHTSSGMWPTFVNVIGTVLFTILAAKVLNQTVELSFDAAKASIATSITNGFGLIFFYIASHQGQLAVPSVISSMAPIVTVALAIIFLRERPGLLRWLGLGATVVGIGILAATS